MGKYDQAAADWTALVTLCEHEVAVRQELKDPDRATALRDAVQAHRDRLGFYLGQKRDALAQADAVRAEKLDEELARLERDRSLKPKQKTTGQVRLVNNWTQTVTVDINGVAYPVKPGEKRLVTLPLGSFTYLVRGYRAARTSSVTADAIQVIRIDP